MNLQSNGQATAIKRNKRVDKRRGSREVDDAQHDLDVIRLASAEVDERVAALHAKIADAAYFRAEKRGFEPGHELDDWLGAEADVAQAAQL